MYTRTENPLHILQEAIDNGVDEGIGGFADTLEVELLPDGAVRIADNGRGIPVGLHPEQKVPTVQLVFTRLHAGGKFDKGSGGAYSFSGGLHGVGVSVTNALSDSLIVTVRRDGSEHRIAFANGDVAVPLERLGASREHGTELVVKPNPKYFDSADIPVGELKTLLQTKAVLLPRFKVVFIDSRNGESVRTEWQYDDGLKSHLEEISGGSETLEQLPVFQGERYATADDGTFSEGEGGQWAFSWFEDGKGDGTSFVNLIPTKDGGTHVSGLKSALFESMKLFIDHHGLLPKGVKLTGEDVFKNVTYVLSARVLDPGFAGQTKDKLTSRECVKLLEKMVQPSFETWLNQNVAAGKKIADITIRNAQARSRTANKAERKKSSSVVLLPGKLTDCETDNRDEAELFLVEGDSAGGSAKQARNKDYQAILPLRGKGKNVWEADKNQALENAEVHDISVALGIAPHTLKDDVDFSKLRYGKIGILADADVDGFHIQVLLLTLFIKHFPQMIDRGHIYVSRPPLYRVDAEAAGKKRPARKVYAMDESERQSWEDRFKKDGYSPAGIKAARFKGLGEMNPPELWETTLNPETRRMLQVRLPEELRAEAMEVFDSLMNKSRPASRREMLEQQNLSSTLDTI